MLLYVTYQFKHRLQLTEQRQKIIHTCVVKLSMLKQDCISVLYYYFSLVIETKLNFVPLLVMFSIFYLFLLGCSSRARRTARLSP